MVFPLPVDPRAALRSRGGGAGVSASKLSWVAKYFDVHPDNPQARVLYQVVGLIRADGLIVYHPTDSCFALGCRLGNKEGIDRIREIRRLDSDHHFILLGPLPLPITGPEQMARLDIRRHQRLGGILNEYEGAT